jgi:hypothetical protein
MGYVFAGKVTCFTVDKVPAPRILDALPQALIAKAVGVPAFVAT